MSDSDERFEITYKQGVINQTKILRDRKTGVNYIFHFEGNAAGLTVLVDENGKPVVTRS